MTITGFSWRMPNSFSQSATTGATSFPLLVQVRNNGSITDNDPTNARQSGGKVVDTITAAQDWVPIIDANITDTGKYAQLPSFAPITIAAGTKAAFWFRFKDNTMPMRANLPKLGISPYMHPNVSSTDYTYQIFQTTPDNALGISWAMQVRCMCTGLGGRCSTCLVPASLELSACLPACLPACVSACLRVSLPVCQPACVSACLCGSRPACQPACQPTRPPGCLQTVLRLSCLLPQATDLSTANWGNVYTFAGDVSYTTCPPPPAASSPPPAAPVVVASPPPFPSPPPPT